MRSEKDSVQTPHILEEPQRIAANSLVSAAVIRCLESVNQHMMVFKDHVFTLVGWMALLGLLVLSGVVGCSSDESEPSLSDGPVEQQLVATAGMPGTGEPLASGPYDAQSWRTMIADDCTTFFDGCNQCRRAPGAMEAACTRKACLEYAEPKCLDSNVGEGAYSSPSEVKHVTYECSDGEMLKAYYGAYEADDQQVQLEPEQIVVLDAASETAYWVRRVPSGSGEKYESSELMFWVKGNEATVSVHARQNVRACSQLSE